MQTLSNGYKLPETGDLGDVWFPALEDNIQRVNDHTHNGTDSEPLESTSIVAASVSVSAGSFTNQGNGYWRATVTVPNGGLVDNHVVVCKDPTTKDQIYLRVEKLSISQVYIYTNYVQNIEVFFS
jgi:hypothetical protein